MIGFGVVVVILGLFLSWSSCSRSYSLSANKEKDLGGVCELFAFQLVNHRMNRKLVVRILKKSFDLAEEDEVPSLERTHEISQFFSVGGG